MIHSLIPPTHRSKVMNLFREQLYRETVCGGTFHSKTSDVAVIALARPRGCLDVHAGRSMVNSLMHLMRRWRNVCEEGTAIFFHGSRREFPVGFILTPQREGYVHGVAGDEFDAGIRRVEAVFERHRPPQMISRLNAVFLAPTIAAISYAGGYPAPVYPYGGYYNPSYSPYPYYAPGAFVAPPIYGSLFIGGAFHNHNNGHFFVGPQRRAFVGPNGGVVVGPRGGGFGHVGHFGHWH